MLCYQSGQRDVGKGMKGLGPLDLQPAIVLPLISQRPLGQNSGLHKAGGLPILFQTEYEETTFPAVSWRFSSVVISLLLLAAV